MEKGFVLFEDWLVIPKNEIVIESEFESEFLQKCIRIRLNQDVEDTQFLKDIQKIKSGYYKISIAATQKLKDLGFL